MADFERLSDFLDSLTVDKDIPGCSIAVYRDNKPLFKYSTGFSDRENGVKMQGDEIFYLYSTTKVITCACALTLLEKGKFLLTDPLCEYLPEFSEMTVKHGDEILPAKKKILIKDLFSMTAGLDYNFKTPFVEQALDDTQSNDSTTRRVVRAFAQRPLSFEPGEKWQYSLCHDVLGGLIEVVSGKSFAEYLKESILEPCGMFRTSFTPDDDGLKVIPLYSYDAATGKTLPNNTGNAHTMRNGYQSGGAGLCAPVDDYILFADALACHGKAANGNRILSPETVDLMRTNMLTPESAISFAGEQVKGYGYGLGVRTLTDLQKSCNCGNIGEFGWGGAAGAYVLIDPAEKLSVFHAQHVVTNFEPYIHPRIRNIVYSCIHA